MELEIVDGLSYVYSKVILVHSRDSEDRSTVASGLFIPKLPLAETPDQALNLPKLVPGTIFCSIQGLKRYFTEGGVHRKLYYSYIASHR